MRAADFGTARECAGMLRWKNCDAPSGALEAITGYLGILSGNPMAQFDTGDSMVAAWCYTKALRSFEYHRHDAARRTAPAGNLHRQRDKPKTVRRQCFEPGDVFQRRHAVAEQPKWQGS